MHILALETSGPRGCVAILDGETLLAEVRTAPQERVARALAGCIIQALALAGRSLAQIDLLAVSLGPGSFTGLRFGITTAKTLAYALKRPVIGAPTLVAIARQAPALAAFDRLEVIADAQRAQAYRQSFFVADGVWNAKAGLEIVDLGDWLTTLSAGTAVSGPLLERCRERLPNGVSAMGEDSCHPTAETIGRIARDEFLAGRTDDLWRLSPIYGRVSAAEEKAAARAEPR